MNNIYANRCDCCKEIWNKDNLKMVAIGEHKLSFCPDCFTEYQKTIMTENALAVLDRIVGEIRGYQGKLNPNLNHDDLITSNAYENVIDMVETHKYLDFGKDEREKLEEENEL